MPMHAEEVQMGQDQAFTKAKEALQQDSLLQGSL